MANNLYIADRLWEELDKCLINGRINPDACLTSVKVSVTSRGITTEYPLQVNDTLVKVLVAGLDEYIKTL